jgi:hypothetical protein
MPHHHCHEGHCHNHDHENTASAECHEKCYCCGQTPCQCGCHHHHHNHQEGEFAHQLLALADEAWMEVLKEKIKEQVSATSGKHLDKLAKLVATSNQERWKRKLSAKTQHDEFHDRIDEFFHHD